MPPSQPGVGRTDYFPWVAISSDCTVITAYCTCPAGMGRSCSHVSAFLYAIWLAWLSGAGGAISTDVTQSWGRGSAKSLVHEKLVDITSARPSAKSLDPCDHINKLNSDQTPCTVQYFDSKEFEESIENSILKPLWNCKGTMLYKMLHTEEEKPRDVEHGSHYIDTTIPLDGVLPCKACDSFYQN